MNKESSQLHAKHTDSIRRAGRKKLPGLHLRPRREKNNSLLCLKSNPDIGAALTTQYRGFEELSDQDVASALEDLADLGYLDDAPDMPSEE